MTFFANTMLFVPQTIFVNRIYDIFTATEHRFETSFSSVLRVFFLLFKNLFWYCLLMLPIGEIKTDVRESKPNKQYYYSESTKGANVSRGLLAYSRKRSGYVVYTVPHSV